MSQTWDSDGRRHPVTVVTVPPLQVTRIKTDTSDGYMALQVGILKNRRPAAQAKAGRLLQEIKLTQPTEHEVGQSIPVSQVFQIGDQVSVSGRSKGHGFTGGVKRWNFKGGPRTHGQSDRERAPGSIGQGTSPGRVHKGKHMAGHHGSQRFTVRNLRVVHLDDTQAVLWLSGPVPGSARSLITIKKTAGGSYTPFTPVSVPEDK